MRAVYFRFDELDELDFEPDELDFEPDELDFEPETLGFGLLGALRTEGALRGAGELLTAGAGCRGTVTLLLLRGGGEVTVERLGVGGLGVVREGTLCAGALLKLGLRSKVRGVECPPPPLKKGVLGVRSAGACN